MEMKETGCGCARGEKPRKKAYITLYREELLYEVRNIAFVSGDVSEDGGHSRHQVQDIGEDGNVDRATRMMDLAFSKCCMELHPWTKKDFACGTERDDIHEERPYYRMMLHVPADFDEPSLTYLTRLCHEYIVSMVLGDWFGIADSEKSAYWTGRGEKMMEEMKGALVGRLGRTRRPTSPF